MTASKKKRNILSAEQHNCCALCGHAFTCGQQNCYDEQCNTLVCRPCMFGLSSIRALQARGVTFETVFEYEKTHRIPG